ncbi:MFS transporter, partial [Rhodoluna sp.]|uniref:MFS transporter n=1 Tax=Rhodoluna sp. TaxID=1969481 RepID=UPI0025D51FA3
MTKTKFGLLAFIAVLAIAMVVRPPVAVMGPLLDEIQQSLHLSTQLVGLLAAAPVLCFGAGAFASPWIVRKLGVDHTMLWVLIGLIIASVERVFFGYLGLLIGTVAVGLSIAVANVLLPTIVRSRFPNHIPLVTGAYTTVVAITASLAATIAVPTSTFFGGWVSALLLWAFPMLLALLLWVPQVRRADPHVIQILGASDDHRRTLNRSPQAWAIVAFFGFQSVGFYAVLGWLPLALISTGLSPDEAGTFLGLTGAIGIPIGLLISSLLGKFKRLSWWAAGSSLLTFVGYLGLTLIVQTRDHTWLLLVCGVLSFG